MLGRSSTLRARPCRLHRCHHQLVRERDKERTSGQELLTLSLSLCLTLAVTLVWNELNNATQSIVITALARSMFRPRRRADGLDPRLRGAAMAG